MQHTLNLHGDGMVKPGMHQAGCPCVRVCVCCQNDVLHVLPACAGTASRHLGNSMCMHHLDAHAAHNRT
jgi:hypothetical protein